MPSPADWTGAAARPGPSPAALGAEWSMGLRLLLVATVVAVRALVLSSLRYFPTSELPRP